MSGSRSLLFLLALVTLAMTAATPVLAGGQNCRLDQREYPENITVCSGGLVLTCANGNWRSNQGRRCEGAPGSYVGARRPFAEHNREEIPPYYKERYLDLFRH